MTFSLNCLENNPYNFWHSSCCGREQDSLACCRDIRRLVVSRNVLVDCSFLSNLFWTFVGSICSTYTLRQREAKGSSCILVHLLNFQCAPWSSPDLSY